MPKLLRSGQRLDQGHQTGERHHRRNGFLKSGEGGASSEGSGAKSLKGDVGKSDFKGEAAMSQMTERIQKLFELSGRRTKKDWRCYA